MSVVVFGAATGSAAVAFAAAILGMLRDAFAMLRSLPCLAIELYGAVLFWQNMGG